MRYSIDQGLLYPALEIEVDGVPPCMLCGDPVARPSMGGPLVCGPCDMGRNRDGSRWTAEQAEERSAHCRARLAEYRAQAIDRRVGAVKELLARPDLDGHACAAAFTTLMGTVAKVRYELRRADARRAEPRTEVWRDAPVDIKIGNLEGQAFKEAATDGWVSFPTDYGRLLSALRVAIEKLQPDLYRELLLLNRGPRPPHSSTDRAAFERSALLTLLAALPDLLAVYDEVSRLAQESPS